MSPAATATLSSRARKGGRTRSGPGVQKGARIKGIWVRRAAFGAILLGLVLGSDALYRWSLASPYFTVRRVEASGTSHLSRSVVRARLGLQRGENLLALDLERLRLRLEGHPWVRTASLSRDLPGTLRVEVVERKPLAVFSPPGRQRGYLLDEEGVILANAGAGSERYPVLRGISLPPGHRRIRAGRTLWDGPIEAGLSAVRAFGSAWPKGPPGGVRLTAVDLSEFSTQGTLRLDVRGPAGRVSRIRLPSRGMQRALRRFAVLAGHWKGRAWPREADLSMGERVVVR